MVKRLLNRLGEALQILAEEEGYKPKEQPLEKSLVDRLIRELTEFIHKKVQALEMIHKLQRQRTFIFEKLRGDENKLEEFLNQLRAADMPMMWEHKDEIIREGKDFGELLKVEINLMEFLNKLKQLEMELQNKLLDWRKERIMPKNIINSLWHLLVKKPEIGHITDEDELITALAQTKDIGILRIIEILYNVDRKFEVLLKREEDLFTQEEIGLLIRDKFETSVNFWHRIEDYNKEETELISLLNEKLIIQNETLASLREQLKKYNSDIQARRELRMISIIDQIINRIEKPDFYNARRLIDAGEKNGLLPWQIAEVLDKIITHIILREFDKAIRLLDSKDTKNILAPRQIQKLKGIINEIISQPPAPEASPWKLAIKNPINNSIGFIGESIVLEAEVVEGPDREAINVGRVGHLRFIWYIEQQGAMMEGAPLTQFVYAGRLGYSQRISHNKFNHHVEPEANKAKLIVYLFDTGTKRIASSTHIDIYIGEKGRVIAPLKIKIINPSENSEHVIGKSIDLEAKVFDLNGNEINYADYNLEFTWNLKQRYGIFQKLTKEELIHGLRAGKSKPIPLDLDVKKGTSLVVDLLDASTEKNQLLVSSDEIDIKFINVRLRINLIKDIKEFEKTGVSFWKLKINNPQNGSILTVGRHIDYLEAEITDGPNKEAINANRVGYLQFHWFIERREPLMQDSPLMQLVHIGRAGSSREIISDKVFNITGLVEAKLVVYLYHSRVKKIVSGAQIDIFLNPSGMRINLLKGLKPSPPAKTQNVLQTKLEALIKELRKWMELQDKKELKYPEHIGEIEDHKRVIRSMQREAEKALEVVKAIKVENNVISNKDELRAIASRYAWLSSFQDLWRRFTDGEISLAYFVTDLTNRISSQIKDIENFDEG